MSDNVINFIKYCKSRIKCNNRKITELRRTATEYEAIIEVINQTDISSQIQESYRNKIQKCFDKIEDYIEENRNNHNLIITMKRIKNK